MRDITETMTFTTEEIRRENIKAVLREVSEALEERGYNSVTRLPDTLSAMIRRIFRHTEMREI